MKSGRSLSRIIQEILVQGTKSIWSVTIFYPHAMQRLDEGGKLPIQSWYNASLLYPAGGPRRIFIVTTDMLHCWWVTFFYCSNIVMRQTCLCGNATCVSQMKQRAKLEFYICSHLFRWCSCGDVTWWSSKSTPNVAPWAGGAASLTQVWLVSVNLGTPFPAMT